MRERVIAAKVSHSLGLSFQKHQLDEKHCQTGNDRDRRRRVYSVTKFKTSQKAKALHLRQYLIRVHEKKPVDCSFLDHL